MDSSKYQLEEEMVEVMLRTRRRRTKGRDEDLLFQVVEVSRRLERLEVEEQEKMRHLVALNNNTLSPSFHTIIVILCFFRSSSSSSSFHTFLLISSYYHLLL